MSEQQQAGQRHFTIEQYKTGVEPYEYLYSIINNPRLHAQEKQRLIDEAKALHAGDIRPFYKAYLETQKAGRFRIDQENSTQFSGQEMPLNCGQYDCTDDGVTGWLPNGAEITICPHPIMPTKRIINIDSGECKTEISFKRGTGSWRKAIFDKSVLASSQKIVQLASQGIAVDSENARGMVSYLSWIENANYGTIPEIRSVGRLGWTAFGFSPYVKDLIFDGMEQYRQAFQAVRQSGTLEAWVDAVKPVRTGKNTAARAMLAASFASALIEPLHALPFICHGWSNASSIGKTVLLMACGSVWANPSMGEYIKTFNSTSVGLEMIAGFYGAMPVCLDELELKGNKRQDFDTMIYQYCQGAGKIRGAKNGGLQRVATWRNCAISTGEEPLTSASSKAGAINRVLDLNCGDLPIFDTPKETVRIIMQNHGHAGKVFVESLTQEALEAIREMWDGFCRQLEGQATDKQAGSAALLLAADAWADAVIFHDGNSLTADDLLPYLQTKAETDVNQRCYDWLIDTIGGNISHFNQEKNQTYSIEAWGDIDEDKSRAYIIKTVFERIMTDEGYSSAGFLNWGRSKSLVFPDGDGHFAAKKRLKNGAFVRCVCLALPNEDKFTVVQEGWPE